MNSERNSEHSFYDLAPFQERNDSGIAYRLPLGLHGKQRYIEGDSARLLASLRRQPILKRDLTETLDMSLARLGSIIDRTKVILHGTPYILDGGYGSTFLAQRPQEMLRQEVEELVPYEFSNGTEVLLNPEAESVLSLLSTDLQKGEHFLTHLSISPKQLSRTVMYLRSVLPPESGVTIVSSQGYNIKAGYRLEPRNQ